MLKVNNLYYAKWTSVPHVKRDYLALYQNGPVLFMLKGESTEIVYSIMLPLMTLTLWSVYCLFYYVVWFDFMPVNVTFVCQFLLMDSEND